MRETLTGLIAKSKVMKPSHDAVRKYRRLINESQKKKRER